MIHAETIVVGTANIKPMLHANPNAMPLLSWATELLQFGQASKTPGAANKPAQIRKIKRVFAVRDSGINCLRVKEGTTNKDKDTQAHR